MALVEGSPRAGSYAQARYRRVLRAWRRRSRVAVWALVSPFLAAGVSGLALAGHYWSWLAGMSFGAGLAVLLALRESPPWYVEKWRIGAEGERKTAKALRRLDCSRWLVLHDIECGRGNYDHVVVGEAGVFLLETKNLQGAVHIEKGVPRLGRRCDPQADESCAWVRSQALGSAACLKEDIERLSGRRIWVQAVVVLWSDFDEGIYEDEKCVFVHGKRIREWLETRPQVLARDVVEDVEEAIRSLAAAGVACRDPGGAIVKCCG